MTTRRLAVIPAADAVGFSSIAERDEEGTHARIKALQQEIIRPNVARHQGRVVKTTGDGFLVEFASPVEAVRCAISIQDAPTTSSLRLRIGINLGDIIIEADVDVYGDGVNIAVRLEGLADAGGICISGFVHDQVEGKIDCIFESRGEQQVKNISRPVRVYALVARDAAPSRAPGKLLPLSDKPAVAVLPFANIGDPEQVYFSDGITDDVITELSRFRELLVIARNSSFSFRGKTMDVREIGRSLGAAYVLEGTVRRAGDRVRVTAQLVDAASGAHLWAERYDRAIEDVFAVQEEIARSIVTTVVQRVIDAGEVAARRRCPEDMRAYDIFLKALRLTGTSATPEALARLEALYQQVLALDPTFARACSGLAFINRDRSIDTVIGVQAQPDEHMLTAMRFVEKALELDPNDPRVQCTFGLMCAHVRNFERAERHLDIAVAMRSD